jgi:hypothetical protein
VERQTKAGTHDSGHESEGLALHTSEGRLKLSHSDGGPPMARSLVLLSLILSLTGCGVAETGAAAAAVAASEAEQARQGLQTEAQVRAQVDAAAKQAPDQRNAAEAAAQ